MTESELEPKADVPTQVFERFLQDLRGAGISEEMIERLRSTLLKEHKFTEQGLAAALFPEELRQ